MFGFFRRKNQDQKAAEAAAEFAAAAERTEAEQQALAEARQAVANGTATLVQQALVMQADEAAQQAAAATPAATPATTPVTEAAVVPGPGTPVPTGMSPAEAAATTFTATAESATGAASPAAASPRQQRHPQHLQHLLTTRLPGARWSGRLPCRSSAIWPRRPRQTGRPKPLRTPDMLQAPMKRQRWPPGKRRHDRLRPRRPRHQPPCPPRTATARSSRPPRHCRRPCARHGRAGSNGCAAGWRVPVHSWAAFSSQQNRRVAV